MKNSDKELLPIDEMDAIWSALTQEERMYLRENTQFMAFKKNEIIYSEGDKPEFLFCLISGKVKVFKEGIGGRQQIIRMISPNENFAYRAYFAGENYLTSASAIEITETYAVPLVVIRQIIESNNRLAIAFIKILSSDLGATDARVVSLTQKHIRGRLAETLVLLLDTYGMDAETKALNGCLSREDIACFANMTASNAIRTLSNFDSEGVITVDGKRIRIMDEALLRKISRQG